MAKARTFSKAQIRAQKAGAARFRALAKAKRAKGNPKPKRRKAKQTKRKNPPAKSTKRKRSSVKRGVRMSKMEETLTIGGGGAAVGLVRRLDIPIPALPVVGEAGTLAAATLTVGYFAKSRFVRKLGQGMFAVAVSELVEGRVVAGEDSHVYTDDDIDDGSGGEDDAPQLTRADLKRLGVVLRHLESAETEAAGDDFEGYEESSADLTMHEGEDLEMEEGDTGPSEPE